MRARDGGVRNDREGRNAVLEVEDRRGRGGAGRRWIAPAEQALVVAGDILVMATYWLWQHISYGNIIVMASY